MTEYTDQNLERLLSDLESDLVERKRSAADRSGIRRNICAFANDLAGHGRPGVILIGVDDKGRPADLVVTDELLRNLAHMRSDGNILPLPSMVIEKRLVAGCAMAVVMVEPARDTPVGYQGRVFVKVGPTVRQATPEKEQRLAEPRRAADLPFDLRPAREAALEDLDLDYVRTQYLPRAVALDVLEQNQRQPGQQLQALRK